MPIACRRHLGALLLLCTSGFSFSDAGTQQPIAVVALEPQTGYRAERRFSGRVEARQRVALGFELAGRIATVAVVEGTRVAAGEVLATLDTQLLEVDARQLEAQAAEVEARLAQVELELRRQERLIAQGYTAQQRVDELSAEQKVLRAQRQRLAAQRDGVAVRLEKSRLSAPFDGEVLRLEAEQGRVVQAGQPLLQLVQTAHNDAVFGVPDQLADALVAGDTVTVSGESGEAGAEALAQVLSVSHSVDPGTLTRTVRVALPDGLAVADSSVIYLHLHEARAEPGAWLPLDALLAGPRGTWAVYALVPDKAGDRNNARDSDKDSGTDGGDTGGHYRLRKHAVSILYQAHDQVYVRTELMVGVPIVSGGLQRLAPDQRVALP